MDIHVQYIDDTKLDHYYTQVSRHSDAKVYPLPDNLPLQELLPGLINFSRSPHKASDACLELKTSSYHRYLDMEYTLKEHIQDFGVSITRKDFIVIKTKLSLLVSALKDKMEQCSYGGGDTRTLRTILKHLPGIIDEDTDFAPELLKQKGLAFLRSLPERDNYTNFDRKKVTTIVLNVLFKIVSYVDGLMAVFRDRSTVSWLYSQVKSCSDARNPEGRNITIAVLCMFLDSELDIEAAPNLCPHDLAVLSIKCAQEVHQREDTPPFSIFIDLLSEKIPSDPETVLAVIQLINKMLETLKEADEMDLFDDLVLALLDQGLRNIIEKHKQGKTAKNKIVQAYNNFSKLLCQEYEDGTGGQGTTGDLDSILKTCINRRPSYQPGSFHSGSEDNLSLVQRDRAKRNSLTNSSLSQRPNDKRDLLQRSMTPDLRLTSPTKTSTSSDSSGTDKIPFVSQSVKDWKRKDFSTPLSNGIGLTSTPKSNDFSTNDLFEKKRLKVNDHLAPRDSYTPGSYRSLYSPAGDSGYQSGSLSRSESNEKIISPHDRHRKEFYEATSRNQPNNLVFTESVPEKKDILKSRQSPYRVKTSDKSEFSFTNTHTPLTAVKSHPYRDNLPSPAGPPRKLDSPFSSYSRPSLLSPSGPSGDRNSQTEKKETENKIDLKYKKQESIQTDNKIINKETAPVSQSNWRLKRQETDTNKTENIINNFQSKWSKQESKSETSDNKILNSDSRTKESKTFLDRQGRKKRLDADQIMSAVQSSQVDEEVPNKLDTSKSDTKDTEEMSPYARYSSYKTTRSKDGIASEYKASAKRELSPEKKDPVPVESSKPLKKRFIELALSSEKAVSIDEKDTVTSAVKMPVLIQSSFEKETPNVSKLIKQESQTKRTDPIVTPTTTVSVSPKVPTSPPAPSKGERLKFADFGCDLATVTSGTGTIIAPFSPDLKWKPQVNYVTQRPNTAPTELQDTAQICTEIKKVPVLPTLPPHDPTLGPSPVSSPTEENPFSKQLSERRKSSESGKQTRVLIPLPEVNLAKHELSFGPIQFLELSSKYDRDPYEAEVRTQVKHIPGTIPAPPPNLPRPDRIPDPPPNIPEVQSGSEGGRKGKRKLNFRWNLVGKAPSEKRRSFWKFEKKFEIPPEIINSFTVQPKSVNEKTLIKPTKPIEKKIEVLEMKRRTSLGVSLKCLQKFEMREDDNNFRNLRKILVALDLEVINEEIIEVLEKGVLISTFDAELAEIRRTKQEALSLGQSVTLREEEKFLLALGEVEFLKERINIATFCLRFHEKEEEIAKKLLILMGAATEIRNSPTFKDVLNTLLHIGNAVEHKQAGGFDLEFLQRAESYKDALQKKDLINHAATYIIEQYPSSTNLYSDFPNVHDAWRMELDFIELRSQISNEQENWSKCKVNVEQLKLANYESLNQKLQQFGHKINKFYITLGRMENYYRDLYLYFGYDKYLADSQKLLNFLKVLHNFSLAYKTNHERIIQIREKMAQEKRREKTRGKKLPIAENIQVKMEDSTKGESGAEDEGTGYSRGVMTAVLEHGSKEKRKPKTGIKYRQAKQNGNRREKRNSIRRTLNEEDGLIDLAKKELADSSTS